MFAEELSGNTSKKRQEDARRRRRQVKKDTLNKEKKKTEKSQTAASSARNSSSTNDIVKEDDVIKKLNKNPSPTLPSSIISSSATQKTTSAISTATLLSSSNNYNNTSSSNSAIETALVQRKVRAHQRIQHNATLILQSSIRHYQSNRKLVQSQRELLERRLNDVITLNQILSSKQQQENNTYAKDDYKVQPVPLAVVMDMVNRLLFITHTTPRFHYVKVRNTTNADEDNTSTNQHSIYHSKIKTTLTKSDMVLLVNIIQHVILPGVLSSDEKLDPILQLWFDGGGVTLRKILRLCLHVLVTKQYMTEKAKRMSSLSFVTQDETEVNVILHFLHILVGSLSSSTKARKDVIVQCRRILLSSSTPKYTSLTGGSVTDIGQLPVSSAKMDVIHLLRSFLLFPPSNGKDGGSSSMIIPPEANELREKCIADMDRRRGDVLFNFVLDFIFIDEQEFDSREIDDIERYQSRFFVEILTCPLLTWKVESTTVHRFVTSLCGTNSAPMLQCLMSFMKLYCSTAVSGGRHIRSSITSILPYHDVPLTKCPAPPALCLLANLVQLGMQCPSINGQDTSKLDFNVAAAYYSVLATILDVVPLGTFSSRQSSVEWVGTGSSHLIPVVLSKIVQDQCKLLLVDSYIRKIFCCAIDDSALSVSAVMNTKDKTDMKHEDEMKETGEISSAKTLAAQEAIEDRSRKFWESNWAKKLSKKVTSIFSGDTNNGKLASSSGKGMGQLLDTSSTSRQLAEGGGSNNLATTTISRNMRDSEKKQPSNNIMSKKKKTQKPYTPTLFYALCRVYAVILSRWGGGGKNDMVKRATIPSNNNVESEQSVATSKADPFVLSLLNVLSFSTSSLRTSWVLLQSDKSVASDLNSLLDANKRPNPIRSLRSPTIFKNRDTTAVDDDDNISAAVLLMFTMTMVHTLIVTDDIELHEMSTPLPPHQIRRCILLLKKLLHRTCCVDDTTARNYYSKSYSSNHLGLSLISASSRVMRDLYDRSSRRPLCVPKLFLVRDLMEADIRRCGDSYDEYVSLLQSPVLRICPFLVSFKYRLKLFERMITTNRDSVQGRNDGYHARPGVSVNITRGRTLEDGLIHLNKLGRNLRQRLIVNYVNEGGTNETGIDAGGIFKEFWTDLSALSFNPNYALFCVTEDSADNCLYPSPSARSAHGSDSVVMFEFLGRILGKALYEGITIQPQFAHFFLSFLRGDYNSLHMLPYLSSLDPTLYNNLMFLKTYDGEASDLCLNFTVTTDDFGVNKEIALMPNGADVDVTSSNKHHYIGLVAKYYVYDRVTEQSQAFTRGLWDVIDREWLHIFNEPELQVLISGPSDGNIDIDDMKANTRYSGGYSSFDRNVSRFWKVVSSFKPKQQADLLRFVTSCERPPPLGFSSMNPPFTIQRIGSGKDGDRLPSASTCFNILKLPAYSSQKVLRDRLLYAISAGAGFELT